MLDGRAREGRSTGSARRSRSGGWAAPTRSRASCTSSPPTPPPTSPARSGRSTAGWTCEQPARRDHPPPARAPGALDAPVRAHGGDLQPVPVADRARAARALRAGAAGHRRLAGDERRTSLYEQAGVPGRRRRRRAGGDRADPRRSARCRPASAPRCVETLRGVHRRGAGRGGAGLECSGTWSASTRTASARAAPRGP